MTIGAVQFPSCRQKGILHLMRGDNGAHDVLNPSKVVMHCILVSGGYVSMTLSADSAAVFFGGVFYKAFVGLVLVFYIFALMAVDTSDLTVHCVKIFLINTIGVPAPHPRGRNASTGYGRRPSRRSSAITVHLFEIGVTLDACAAGRPLISSERRSSQGEDKCNARESDGHKSLF
jgi:hypothetical protein